MTCLHKPKVNNKKQVLCRICGHYMHADGLYHAEPPQKSLGTGLENSKRGNTGAGWFEFPEGKRYYLKSTWEYKYALYLQLLKERGAISDWEYEPDTFWFEGIKRGTNNYKPDFKVYFPDGKISYVEVKGYWDSKSLTKLKRMKKYHPKVELKKVDKEWFNKMNPKLKGLIW